jgi:hypothetical protein
MGRLGLGLLGLEGEVFGSSALLARDCIEDLFLGLGRRRFGPKQLAEHSIALIVGTAATTWSTALARDVGGRKILAERQGTYWRALARARARLPSVYPLRDHSRSQVFVNEGES